MKKYQIKRATEIAVRFLLKIAALVLLVFLLSWIWSFWGLRNAAILSVILVIIWGLMSIIIDKVLSKPLKEFEYDRYFSYRDEKKIDKNLQHLIDEIGEKEQE